MKVLIPAKCGSSPRENVGMSRSTIDEAAGRPARGMRFGLHPLVGSSPSLTAERHPFVDGFKGPGVAAAAPRQRRERAAGGRCAADAITEVIR